MVNLVSCVKIFYYNWNFEFRVVGWCTERSVSSVCRLVPKKCELVLKRGLVPPSS
jgi:hypothetical protein